MFWLSGVIDGVKLTSSCLCATNCELHIKKCPLLTSQIYYDELKSANLFFDELRTITVETLFITGL